jgi:uncharacterized protein (UPF0333 family)
MFIFTPTTEITMVMITSKGQVSKEITVIGRD